jgi:hypothetical protein
MKSDMLRPGPARLLSVSLLVLLVLAGMPSAKAAPNDPAVSGQWSNPIPTPTLAMHTALLPNGKVLLIGRPAQDGKPFYRAIRSPVRISSHTSSSTACPLYRKVAPCNWNKLISRSSQSTWLPQPGISHGAGPVETGSARRTLGWARSSLSTDSSAEPAWGTSTV